MLKKKRISSRRTPEELVLAQLNRYSKKEKSFSHCSKSESKDVDAAFCDNLYQLIVLKIKRRF
jgi:hypothetical protein